MNHIQKLLQSFDKKQRQHSWLGFTYAVIKKYGEDQAGYQAALLTYYGFLSLFPLLLILTTVLQLAAGSHHGVEGTIIRSITNYFPVLGNQLSTHIHTLHKSGIALIVGILFTFYGARGVADVFRQNVNHIWGTPVSQRDSFPKSTTKSLLIIIIGGLGFMLASLFAGYAGTVGHSIIFRALSLLINVFILFWLFTFLLNISLPKHVSLAETRAGAAAAAIGLVILQGLGSYLLARELKSLDALYSTFAITLGLLFWLYLQAQVVCYSVEVAAVSSKRLWPRAFDAAHPTDVDRRLHSK